MPLLASWLATAALVLATAALVLATAALVLAAVVVAAVATLDMKDSNTDSSCSSHSGMSGGGGESRTAV